MGFAIGRGLLLPLSGTTAMISVVTGLVLTLIAPAPASSASLAPAITAVGVSCTTNDRPSYERVFTVKQDGLIEGSSPEISIWDLNRLLKKAPLTLREGLGPMLQPEILKQSEPLAFQAYTVDAGWYGISTPEQKQAFRTAYLSPAVHLNQAQEAYSASSHGHASEPSHCVVRVGAAAPSLAIEFDLFNKPYLLPLYIVQEGKRVSTYDPSLSEALASLFPDGDYTRHLLKGEGWARFLGSVGGTLGPALNKASIKPEELLAKSPAPINRLKFVGAELDGANVRWTMTLRSTVVPNLSSVVFGHIVNNKLEVSDDQIAVAKKRLATVEMLGWLIRRLRNAEDIELSPLSYEGSQSGKKEFAEDAPNLQPACDLQCQNDAIVVKVTERNGMRSNLYTLVLLPDSRVVLWQFSDSLPSWHTVGNAVKKNCVDGTAYCAMETIMP